MSIKENIENFIDAIKVGSYNEAQSIFSGLMNDKLQDRIEAEKIAVAGSIFNGADEDIFFEELDELEEGKKYKKEEEEDEDDLDVDVDEVEDEDDDDDENEDEDDEDDEEEMKMSEKKKRK